MERNERYNQTEEWSDPASEGGRRRDAPIPSPTNPNRQPRTTPTPAPSEEQHFTDWSSIGSGSPPVISTFQSVPLGGTLTTPGIEGNCETRHATPQPCQPTSQETHVGAINHVSQEELSATQQPLAEPGVVDERRMSDMGTNTSDVVIQPTR